VNQQSFYYAIQKFEEKLRYSAILVTTKDPSMYIRMRVLPGNTVGVGQVGSISAPFGEPTSRFTSAIERSGKWKKVR
jgi:hypothetical protein